MKYTNETKVENYMMIDIDSSLSAQVGLWGNAVDNYIDRYTGRKDGFEAAAASAKYFDGSGKREIDIDEFSSITLVQILESNSDDVGWTLTEGLDNDYIAYPYNETPQYRLILTTNAGVGAWYKGSKRIKITAIWGHSASVPADIELAATMLLASIVEKGSRGGKVRAEALGDYSVTYESIDETSQAMGVKKILDSYKLYKL